MYLATNQFLTSTNMYSKFRVEDNINDNSLRLTYKFHHTENATKSTHLKKIKIYVRDYQLRTIIKKIKRQFHRIYTLLQNMHWIININYRNSTNSTENHFKSIIRISTSIDIEMNARIRGLALC